MSKVVLRCQTAVLGDATVGKTALLQMFHSKGRTFPKAYNMTLGFEMSMTPIPVDQDKSVQQVIEEGIDSEKKDIVQLFVLDCGGQTIYSKESKEGISGCSMFIFVYDVSRKSSFDNLLNWYNLAKEAIGRNPPGCLIANKCDLNTSLVQVPAALGKNFADRHGLKFYESSAQLGQEVAPPFAHVAQSFHDVREE